MIETPRLVKRLGPDGIEHKRVETESDLAAALATGWRVSLADAASDVPTPAPPPDEPPPVVEVLDTSVDADSAGQDDAGTADEAPEGAEIETAPEPATDKPKRGRPRR